MKYIIAIGIFQGLLAAFLLFRSRKKNNADYLLVSLATCIALHLSLKFFIYTYVNDPEVKYMMNTFIGFSYLPILYLFTLKSINVSFIPASKWYVFIPLIVGAIGYFVTAIILLDHSPHAYLFLNQYNSLSGYGITYLNLFFSGLILFQLYKNKITQAPKTLIIQLMLLFLIMPIVGVLLPFLQELGLDTTPNMFLIRSFSYIILIAISIRIILYRSSFSESILEEKWVDSVSVVNKNSFDELTKEENISKTKKDEVITNPVLKVKVFENEIPQKEITARKREILSDSQMFKIVLKLENGMKNNRYFTDSELSLDKLAKFTNLNKYHISETLNHFLNKSFYTFVNEYRIEMVKNKLEDYKQSGEMVTILDLAYEAGFNSKSSFNRYFKEINGNTPSEYLKMFEESSVTN